MRVVKLFQSRLRVLASIATWDLRSLQGEAVLNSLVWVIVPAIVLFYLFAPADVSC